MVSFIVNSKICVIEESKLCYKTVYLNKVNGPGFLEANGRGFQSSEFVGAEGREGREGRGLSFLTAW